MHDSARFQRADTAGLCERPDGPEISRHRQQARIPQRGFSLLAKVAVIVTNTYVLRAQQTVAAVADDGDHDFSRYSIDPL